MRLAGRRGEALEAFWAGKATAADTLARIEPAAHKRATAGNPSVQFRCDVPTASQEPKKCWLCDGTGIVEQHDDRQDRYGKFIPGPTFSETCMNCLGLGVERG